MKIEEEFQSSWKNLNQKFVFEKKMYVIISGLKLKLLPHVLTLHSNLLRIIQIFNYHLNALPVANHCPKTIHGY